jgi:PEP-CTERM motif
MKRTVIAALGAGVIAAFAANSAAEAAIINFAVASLDGAVTYTGTSLDVSTALDLDGATLLVTEVNPADDSGLAVFGVGSLSAATSPASSHIIYGSGTGPGPLGAVVTLSWTATTGPDVGDKFTETLTSVMSISRTLEDQIGLILTGTVTDTGGLFSDTPVLLSLTANQALGSGTVSSSFTNGTTGVTPSIPEPSTWVMMGMGFGALGGYAASRQRKAKVALLPI